MDDLREKVIKGLERCTGEVDCDRETHHNYCPYWNNGCFEHLIRDALSLLKAQEQEIQQLKATHISASDNAIACGVIHGSVTINQKAKEIMNIKNVEVFNG